MVKSVGNEQIPLLKILSPMSYMTLEKLVSVHLSPHV